MITDTQVNIETEQCKDDLLSIGAKDTSTNQFAQELTQFVLEKRREKEEVGFLD
jgi:hypothetical protein